MRVSSLQQQLLNWFEQNKRDLPWRKDRTPYRVWISEIMLQQTRVDTVIDYYQRWMQCFPDVFSLAASDEDAVLQAWEGLGYYSRARLLRKAAQIIVIDHRGIFPSDPLALEKLPGVGKYTAGAISSIMFGVPAAALDGNVRRILSRLDDYDQPVRTPSGEKHLWQLASEFLNKEHPGDHNEALMDLGSLICLPTHPKCADCPLHGGCMAYQNGTVDQRPMVTKKAPIPKVIVTAAVVRRADRYMLAKRPEGGLLGGMWEFPGGKLEAGETLQECLIREIHEELDAAITVGEEIGVYKHAYTHMQVTLHAFSAQFCPGETPQNLEAQALEWVTTDEMPEYPMGKIDRMIAQTLANQNNA